MKQFLISISFTFLWFILPASDARKQYIEKWKKVAIDHMHEFGIPASITLSQGLLESNNGLSRLAMEANNHFGIKCHNDWSGDVIYHDDDKKNECFRRYASVDQSYRDHALFLKNKSRYKFLFAYKNTDYKSWAKGLKKAGYATNKKYDKLLIQIIEEYNLSQYDKVKQKRKKKKKEDPIAAEKPVLPDSTSIDSSEKVLAVALSVREILGKKPKYLLAKAGETPETIAKELDLGEWQIRTYNDISKDHVFQDGETVYIQPKKKKGKKDFLEVKTGRTIWGISQEEAIKVKSLLKYNPGITLTDSIPPGKKIRLK